MICLRAATGYFGVRLLAIAAALFVIPRGTALTQPPNDIPANEAAAISSLRRIAAAQAAFKAAVDVDTNCDGVGEYGYIAEMNGTVPMRVGCGGVPCVPCAGSPYFDELSPPLLRGSFTRFTLGCATHQGYVFAVWLPGATVGGRVAGLHEDFTGGKAAAPYPDPANGARMWCCYAWPLRYGASGRSAFFVDQRGEVLACDNAIAHPFGGRLHGPGFDSAFSRTGDMAAPLRIGTPGHDGTVWRPVP